MDESYRLFTWDWKEQPPLADILTGAQAVAAGEDREPAFFYYLPATGGDYYACIISQRDLDAEQITAILESGD
jgi:hypothetical protein